MPKWCFQILSVVCLTVLASSAATGGETVGRRHALIIGISKALKNVGSVQKLRFVERDLLELEKLLRREGYEVTTVPNDRADRRRILEELSRHISTLTPADTFVLYYAGHGVRNMEVNQKTYWLTYDSDLRMLDVEGIRLEHLLSYVSDIRASRKLILLDHCFSGDVERIRLGPDLETAVDTLSAPPPASTAPAESATTPRLSSRSATLVDIERELSRPGSAGTTVFAAARNEAYELEKLEHGVFTAALLDACSIADGVDANLARSAYSLIRFVKPRVRSLLETAKPVGTSQPPYQEPVARTEGDADVGLGWTFCMAPVPAGQVTARAAEYSATIQRWAEKGLLGFDNVADRRRLITSTVLDKWKAGNGVQTGLEDREHRLLVAIRMFAAAADDRSDEARAALLRDALYREGY